MSLCHQLCGIFKWPSDYNTKWKLTEKFKQHVLEGDVQALKAKALQLEFLQINEDYIQLKIKVTDQNGDGISYIDYKDTIKIGDTITLMDLNHLLIITIS